MSKLTLKPAIVLVNILLHVDLKDDESICSAHKAIWNAELDLLQRFNVSRCNNIEDDEESRDFDNYDICDPDLKLNFIEKVNRLVSWCNREDVWIV